MHSGAGGHRTGRGGAQESGAGPWESTPGRGQLHVARAAPGSSSAAAAVDGNRTNGCDRGRAASADASVGATSTAAVQQLARAIQSPRHPLGLVGVVRDTMPTVGAISAAAAVIVQTPGNPLLFLNLIQSATASSGRPDGATTAGGYPGNGGGGVDASAAAATIGGGNRELCRRSCV
ncbi:hypothetical protein Vretimale_15649 [Volvox reticuliferus]|uniref:Uncharacterized protein n=1 Tax=Volvox reticuliferus TaxID=1737510 RepID=A0A8J4LVY2_9CHLO|nr:hypothetical protein Vretimale_15649 [Volvox reticuliferus]